MVDSLNRDTAAYRRKELAAKALIAGLVVLFAMVCLLSRLTWLQVVHYKYYKARSLENSSRVVFLRAPRGVIYDRNGNLLAANKQSLSLVVIPSQLEDIWSLTKRLSIIIDLPARDVYERLEKAKQSNSVLPIVIERDLDLNVVGRLIEQQLFLPGVDIIPDISRTYPQGEIAAHVLGYTGEISPEQLKVSADRKMGDIVGQDGIERTYDEQVRGIDGEQRVKVHRPRFAESGISGTCR
jgi:penicillin-binding protein 2